MGASSRTLEITVISGENLHATDEAYVVVRAESINCCTTKTVKDSGTGSSESCSFLSWNEKLLLDMPVHARSITLEVQCKKLKGARPVGVARIAVSDFLGEGVPENCSQVLSYRLRNWEGRRNGVIHFAVRVMVSEECSVSTAEPTKGMVKDSDDRLMGGHVGVPFWWNYPNLT